MIRHRFADNSRKSLAAWIWWRRLSVCSFCLAGMVLQACAPARSQEPVPELSPRHDHHVHLLSPKLVADWKSTGMPFSRTDEHYCDPAFVLEELELDRAAIVSMAHLYVSSWLERLELTPEEQTEQLRRENDFIADCVGRHPDRLVGYFSVNPLQEGWLAELEHQAARPGIVGVKLHLPACGIDLGDEQHRQAFGALLARCDELRQGLLVHVFGGDEPPGHADRFWALLEPYPQMEVIIAHAGSSGGFNDRSQALISGFADLVSRQTEFETAPVWFDLSGAVLVDPEEDLPPTSEADCQRLGEAIRQLGTHRFLFATDYPVFSREQILRGLSEKTGLTAAELQQVFANQSRSLAALPGDQDTQDR
jgi:uncharacterized protein